MSDAVLFQMQGPVALITINRPDSRNAINAEVRSRAVRRLEALRG